MLFCFPMKFLLPAFTAQPCILKFLHVFPIKPLPKVLMIVIAIAKPL